VIERGECEIGLDSIYRIAYALVVEPKDLLETTEISRSKKDRYAYTIFYK
jgi:hypothetical protein